jgi:hypothetical protein
MRPGAGYLPATLDDAGPVGPLAGLPVYMSGGVPSDLGAGRNQDTALTVRGPDLYLLESDPYFQAIVEGQGAEELTVYLGYHHYTCFIPDRYPSSIGSVTGTGFVVPSGW